MDNRNRDFQYGPCLLSIRLPSGFQERSWEVYKVHGCHFRCSGQVSRAGVRIRYTSYCDGTIVHHKSKSFVGVALVQFAHGNASLRTNCFGGNMLQLADVEPLVAFAQLVLFVSQPSCTVVAEEAVTLRTIVM